MFRSLTSRLGGFVAVLGDEGLKNFELARRHPHRGELFHAGGPVRLGDGVLADI